MNKPKERNLTPTNTKAKYVHIVCSSPLKDVAVRLTPNDTAATIIEKAGLQANHYLLMKPGDHSDYGPTDLPFSDTPDGSKLHVQRHVYC